MFTELRLGAFPNELASDISDVRPELITRFTLLDKPLQHASLWQGSPMNFVC
jgi:hypothetical protein